MHQHHLDLHFKNPETHHKTMVKNQNFHFEHPHNLNPPSYKTLMANLMHKSRFSSITTWPIMQQKTSQKTKLSNPSSRQSWTQKGTGQQWPYLRNWTSKPDQHHHTRDPITQKAITHSIPEFEWLDSTEPTVVHITLLTYPINKQHPQPGTTFRAADALRPTTQGHQATTPTKSRGPVNTTTTTAWLHDDGRSSSISNRQTKSFY